MICKHCCHACHYTKSFEKMFGLFKWNRINVLDFKLIWFARCQCSMPIKNKPLKFILTATEFRNTTICIASFPSQFRVLNVVLHFIHANLYISNATRLAGSHKVFHLLMKCRLDFFFLNCGATGKFKYKINQKMYKPNVERVTTSFTISPYALVKHNITAWYHCDSQPFHKRSKHGPNKCIL